MKIIAHRGLWKTPAEKNTLNSMGLAWKNGFGVETDLRDYDGKLVISHDPAGASSPEVESLFSLYQKIGRGSTLALNVKADGIQPLLKPLLKKYKIADYFLFDMSVPELVACERYQLSFYTRQSDIEQECVRYAQAEGVWLDSFYQKEWLTASTLDRHLAMGKKICIVSPELHHFPCDPVWSMLKSGGYQKQLPVALCTDMPERAVEYFYG